MLVTGPITQLDGSEVKRIEIRSTELGPFGNHFGTQIILYTLGNLALGQNHQLLNQNPFQVCHLRFKLIVNLGQQSLISQLRATVLNHTREKFLIDDNPFQRRRSLQRSIFHIARLIAEDSAKQFLFGRRVRLAFRRNLANHDIPRFDTGADSHDTVLVQVFSRLFTYVRNIGSQLFHASFRFADLQRILFHMNGSQQVFTHHTFIQNNGILIVISLPRHISHQQVLS